jgi:hypothetical protein
MAFPLIPLIAGAAIGSVVTYILKDKGVQDAIRLRGEQLREEIMKRTHRAASEAEAAAAAAVEAVEEAASPEAQTQQEEQVLRTEEERRNEAQPITH